MVKKRKRQPSEEKIVPLRELRESLGLSQARFAVAIGVDPSTISRCERGLAEISLTIAQVKALCSLTGKRLDDLPDYLGKDPNEDE